VTETERRRWDDVEPDTPHIWLTLGYRSVAPEQAYAIEWDASVEYAFPSPSGPIMHGGMVTTILDTAMGGACWTVLKHGETFLTVDLRVEFLRAARPGLLRAEGAVIHRGRRVAFCSADLFDAERALLATARCTQLIRAEV
jgi:uncharacterized protein (TIGR00369 family)